MTQPERDIPDALTRRTELTTEYQELYCQFLDFETELELYSLRPDGIQIWPWIRIAVGWDIFKKSGVWGRGDSEQTHGITDNLRGLYLLLRNVVRRNPFLTTESDIVFWGQSRRKFTADGTWWDIYCDPIHEESQYSYVHFEEPYQNRHFTPAVTDQLRYLDLIVHWSTLKREAGMVNLSVSDDELATIKQAERQIEARFDVTVDIESILRTKLAIAKETIPLFKRLLKRIEPELAVVVPGSGKEPFIYSCQEFNVPVVELQHGIITEYSLDYSFPGERTKETFADYLLTFGEYWNEMPYYPIDADNVQSVGFPFLEKELTKHRNEQTQEQIVLVSQGEVGTTLSKFAVALEGLLDDSYSIVYKLHPGEFDRWRVEYPWLVESDIAVVKEDPTLYHLFSKSTVQVGTFSMALYEGLAFDLETYLLPEPGIETMHGVIDAGAASIVSTPEALIEDLTDERSPSIDKESLFKPDAIANISNLFGEIRSNS